jgi:hypothetical protein
MFPRTLSALGIIAALVSGSILIPAPAHAQAGVDLKFYDSSHKDYHHWDHDEDVRYRAYLNEHHRKYQDFGHQNKKHQQAYWNWRHENEHHR